MTKRFNWACWRASSKLPRADASCVASRLANSPATSAITNKPSPPRPDCSNTAAASAPANEAGQAAASSISATPAAVPNASNREVSTPAIKTGSTSSAA